MADYNPQKIEKKWQKIWDASDFFQAKDGSKKPKFYILVEFPYPSGTGLHVGHCRSYIGLDILSRQKRMQGFNVMFPMGWDAFGLPTENYAIKTGIHPAVATKKNTDNFRKQEKKLGLSFDWSREINTTDPAYYKWTQWIFVQLFKNGLAYKAKMPINWCPSCKIGLANEEVIGGKCERCGAAVARKEKEQWLIRITKYAERLIADLDKVEYPERVKVSQKEWIGKSEGTEIKFSVLDSDFKINVFTTRPDTLFGCTYLVLAPEHPLLEALKGKIENYKYVGNYIEQSKLKLERERTSRDKEKTGVELRGIKAINPANNREVPIFIADYVLMHYGTGAIMAVPSHDQRDYDFAKSHNLAVIDVIRPFQGSRDFETAFEAEGTLINSGRFDGMDSSTARERITEWLAQEGIGGKATHYKLRDWIFSRQRYWGEPIPMVLCPKCGWVPALEQDLPVKLPKIKNYKPTERGESPLAHLDKWVKTRCPRCQEAASRETDVMPNWAGSNWYYLRYCDPKNNNKLADSKKLKYWMPVDWYNGGMEHTTLHLLYSRFTYKFLWDIGSLPKILGPEPYKKRTSHGIILGEGGIKMSKSKGNVIDPQKVSEEYGTDTLRVYEMFMGPFEQMIPWDTKGVIGSRRFLERVWKLAIQEAQETGGKEPSVETRAMLNKTIKKISGDVESLKFNTAVSALMEFINVWQAEGPIGKKNLKAFLIILSPFAPHIAEELWEISNFPGYCCRQKWPEFEEKSAMKEKITLIVQINGKVRDKMEIGAGLSDSQIEEIALASDKIKKWTAGNPVKKIIVVKGRLVNIVL